MQEEVENKTVNLAITTTKVTGRVLFRGMQMYMQHRRSKNLSKIAAKESDSSKQIPLADKLFEEEKSIIERPVPGKCLKVR